MSTKRLQRAWLGFEKVVISPKANQLQRAEMQKAFFAGAACLRHILFNELSDGDDASEADESLLTELDEELREFGAALDQEVLGKKVNHGS